MGDIMKKRGPKIAAALPGLINLVPEYGNTGRRSLGRRLNFALVLSDRRVGSRDFFWGKQWRRI